MAKKFNLGKFRGENDQNLSEIHYKKNQSISFDFL